MKGPYGLYLRPESSVSGGRMRRQEAAQAVSDPVCLVDRQAVAGSRDELCVEVRDELLGAGKDSGGALHLTLLAEQEQRRHLDRRQIGVREGRRLWKPEAVPEVAGEAHPPPALVVEQALAQADSGAPPDGVWRHRGEAAQRAPRDEPGHVQLLHADGLEQADGNDALGVVALGEQDDPAAVRRTDQMGARDVES